MEPVGPAVEPHGAVADIAESSRRIAQEVHQVSLELTMASRDLLWELRDS